MTNSPAVAADAVEPLPRLPIEAPHQHCADDGPHRPATTATFMRQITRHTLLYTEMVTAQAITYGDPGDICWLYPR